jgi:hypothetical protein
LPWKLVAIALACIAVIAVVAVLRPREKPVVEEEGISPPAGENVSVRYSAMFTYVESVGNTMLENVVVNFPCPHIGGENRLPEELTVILYHQRNDEVTKQVENGMVLQLVAPRTSAPQIRYSTGNVQVHEPVTLIIPEISIQVSDLYPGEGIAIVGHKSIPAEEVENLSICHYENLSYVYYAWDPDVRISLFTGASLDKEVEGDYQGLEGWSVTREDERSGMFLTFEVPP